VSSETPASAASQAAVLRRAWSDVCATVAPQLADLPALLDARLGELEAAGSLDEATLLGVAEEASQYALENGAAEIARSLSKRLRRAIYEFLLALDAVNPAEWGSAPVMLTPPPAVVMPTSAAAPAPVAEPRTPVAFMPSDVPGADDPAAAVAHPVPMWEEVAPPAQPAREVYRVATHDAVPQEAPAVEEPAAVVELDEMASVPEAVAAEFAAAEAESDETEAHLVDAEAHAAEVVEALAEAEAEAPVEEWNAAEVPEAPEAVVEAEPVATFVAEGHDDGPAAEEPVAAAFEEPAAEAVAPDPWVEPAAEEPVAEAPTPLADTQPVAPQQPQTNGGAKPPRDLLRVPRQFRRLPPMAGRHDEPNGATPEAPEAPAEDDSFGVPALPWMVAETPEPLPEPEATTPEPEPTAEHDEDPEGVPFGPFAFPAEPDADLPRPPALAEEPLHAPPAATAADQLFISPVSTPDPGAALWTPGPVAPPSYAQTAPEPFPIAPREGFHLTDPGALELPEPNPFVAAPDAPAPTADVPPALAAPEHEDHDEQRELHEDGTWRIRQSPRAQLLAERMAQKRREEASRAAFEAASVHEDERGRRGRKRRAEDEVPDLPTARRQLDEHLRKKRGSEAGALLQRLAQLLGGREIADLALDSGDRCRALGQSRSATNCYLAAWRADPVYETPLWRLSDICLNDQEIELAVGYLERIAELMRSRGDDEGAIGVYRKIAMIAPERQDVRDVIRLAKTTGRLEG
jgi:hypothetical protein